MILKLKPKKIMGINYSCLIVLPKSWLDHHSLRKGDNVDLGILDDGTLIIKPSGVEINV